MNQRSRYVFGAALAGMAFGGISSLINKAHGALVTNAAFTFENVNSTFFPTQSTFGTKTSSSAGNTKYTVTTSTGTNYQAYTGASIGPFQADSGTGTAFGSHASTSTVWTLAAGNGSPNALSSTPWTVGDYYQFNVPTTGIAGIIVTFDETSSGTGPGTFSLLASSDGANFSTISNYTLRYTDQGTATSFATSVSNTQVSYSFDLSSITALDQNASDIFRIVDNGTTAFNPASSVGSAGTDRIDNFIVAGTSAVPEPAALSLVTVAAATLLLRRKDKIANAQA